MQEFFNSLMTFLGANVMSFVSALAILIVGWLVAKILGAAVRGLLRRTKIDDKIAGWIVGEGKEGETDISSWVGKAVFYLAMLFVLVAFFQTLGLTVITEPLNQLLVIVFQYIPLLLGGALLLLLAWVVATVLRIVVKRVLGIANLDERLSESAGLDGEEKVSLGDTLGDAVYWLVFLLFLPAILGALGLEGLLSPVQGMVDQILGFLPSLFGAIIILLAGWFAARILQRVVSNLLSAVGVDRFSESLGLENVLGSQKLSGVLGLLVYILVFIPVVVASLNSLGLDAITEPASNMLDLILLALPAIFAALLVLVLAYVVGKVVSKLVANLLDGAGFNKVLAKLGLKSGEKVGQRTPADIVGYLIMVAIMLFAATEAANLLGFTALSDIVGEFTVFAGQILLGLVIFGIGLFLANLAASTIETSTAKQSNMLALVARISILVLAGAMALRQMGLANEIIELGFGLLLGAVAVAAALAFGLGGRDIAAKKLSTWSESIETDDTK
jgi:hypothetical protein